mmetsp:Transcript_14944/g.20359  ORF Transcript_14944/g.20359 Transcript_14944/m.20359 type:complete len:600 (-) Transcript_14944:176-1975(-)|eukprot:CAMPEP_0185739064 /NCGR_PEP_ID=MMETSP1171-20130828/34509_1 /TAXON_ID=374046 /ORGANISM="Helicotheca tamensis, Strain CCMP826" /LENGTH=599 /DNA_ID=CAMNT_0028410503 /DNA_START=176 /DNA_END=1975 /DNA_ORIENTATION=-
MTMRKIWEMMTLMVPSTNDREMTGGTTAFVNTSSGLARDRSIGSADSSDRNDATEVKSDTPPSSTSTTLFVSSSPKDEYLRPIPPQLYPTYRPIPFLSKCIIAIFSLVSSTFWTLLTTARIQHEQQIKIGQVVKKILVFLARAIVISLATSALLQDLYLPPSRVSIQTLVQNQWLPSYLSRYEIISPLFTPTPKADSLVGEKHEGDKNKEISLLQTIKPIGVHYLLYDNNKNGEKQKKKRFDAVYFNHGFGASSLSWLPAIPSVVHKLNAKVGVAHDAVGFGFTDRPPKYTTTATSTNKAKLVDNELALYSSAGSAALGMSLLDQAIRNNSNDGEDSKDDKSSNISSNDDAPSAVALLGHSRGSAATLRMALDLPRSTRKFIVLVSPYLMGSVEKNKIQSLSNQAPNSTEASASLPSSSLVTTSLSRSFDIPVGKKTIVGHTIATFRKIFFEVPLQYVLRRLVGGTNFWKKGLQMAWGDPTVLTDNDVLRFQWPSVGKGWEGGIISYTRSVGTRSSSVPTYPGGEVNILRDVLSLPNTYVAIVHGTNDRVVPWKYNAKYTESFPNLRFVKMDGFGHDPFEEDVDKFVGVVEKLLKESES